LNNMDIDESNNVIQNIRTHSPGIMKELETRIFALEDLALLPNEKLKQVLDVVPPDRLAISLKSTSNDFGETILSALGMRARRMVEAELASESAYTQNEIDKARKFVVDTVLKFKARESGR